MPRSPPAPSAAAGEPLPLARLHDFWTTPGTEDAGLWLADGGTRLVLANVWGAWLFLRVVDVPAQTVVARVSLRTPEPLGELVLCVDGDRLRIAGSGGGVLELAWPEWRISGWRRLQELLPGEARIECAMPLPGGSELWLRVETVRHKEWQTYVVDLGAWRLGRSLAHHGVTWSMPIAGAADPWVIYAGYDFGSRLYSFRGTPAGGELPLHGEARAAAIDPTGEGLLVMVPCYLEDDLGEPAADDPEEEEPGMELLWLACSAGGGFKRAASLRFDDAFEPGSQLLATSLDLGLGFALVHALDSERWLVAVRVSTGTPGALEEIYRQQVALDSTLVWDRHSRHAALVMAGERLRAVTLGRQPPAVGPIAEALAFEDRRFPDADGPFFCDRVTDLENATVQALEGRLRGLAGEERRGYLERYQARHAGDVEALMALCLSLRRLPDGEAGHQRLLQSLAGGFAGDPGVAMQMATVEVEAGRWKEVRRLLEDLDPAGLDADQARHLHHLLGLAQLHGGERRQARETFERGLACDEGTCHLDCLVHLTRPMADPPAPADWAPTQPVARQLLGAVLTADHALAAGDHEAAIEALERPLVWQQGEVQTAARLAAAYLASAAESPAEPLRGEEAEPAVAAPGPRPSVQRSTELATQVCESLVRNRVWSYRDVWSISGRVTPPSG